MSIRNKIVNNWYNLDLVSHLDQDGKVKPIKKYKQEVKQVIPDIYHEHATLLKDAQDSLFVKTFTNLGKLLSGNVSLSINYQKLSPIDHYNYRGYLKTQKEFKEDLKDYLETLYSRHDDMIYHDNASYLELIGNHMAKSIMSSICSVNLSPESLIEVQESFLNFGSAIFHGVAATSYVIAGNGTLGLNIGIFSYNTGQYIASNLLENVKDNIDTLKEDLKDFGSAVGMQHSIIGTLSLNAINSAYNSGQYIASNLLETDLSELVLLGTFDTQYYSTFSDI